MMNAHTGRATLRQFFTFFHCIFRCFRLFVFALENFFPLEKSSHRRSPSRPLQSRAPAERNHARKTAINANSRCCGGSTNRAGIRAKPGASSRVCFFRRESRAQEWHRYRQRHDSERAKKEVERLTGDTRRRRQCGRKKWPATSDCALDHRNWSFCVQKLPGSSVSAIIRLRL